MRKSLLFLFILLPIYCTFSQSDDTLLKKFKETFQNKYFSIGVYLQTIGDFQFERRLPGNNGFTLTNARLKIYGEFDEAFGYYFQSNMAVSRPVLDAYVYHKFSDYARLDIGQFKAPFSGEYLTSSSAIDFVNRSQATGLAPKRQVGLQLKGNLTKEFTYSAGIFNGNGTSAQNDNDNFMYTGRVTYAPEISGAKLTFGINAAFNKETEEGINSDHTIFGGDIRYETEKLIFSGEFIQQDSELSGTGIQTTINGYHITGGYKISDKVQVLARYDVLNYVDFSADNQLIIAGLNYFPTSITKFQINYLINTDDTELAHNQILLKAQIAF